MANSNTSVITKVRRINLAKITRGAVATIPKITHIAFGDGGVDSSGQPLQPNEIQTALNNEIGRYEIDSVETTNRYTVTIPNGDLNGKNINETITPTMVDGQLVICGTTSWAVQIKHRLHTEV